MITYHRAEPRETAEIIEFINMVFSMAHSPFDFKRGIPKVYGDDACIYAQHYIARKDGKIVGVVGLMPGMMHIGGEALKTGVIGSVSTHPYERGGGYMKECMRLALEDARTAGMHLLSLGGQRQRYEYFGFVPGGKRLVFHLNSSNFRHAFKEIEAGEITFAEISEEGSPYLRAAVALHASQDLYTERSGEQFLRIAHTWEDKLYAILDGGVFIGSVIASGDGNHIKEITMDAPGAMLRVMKGWYEQKSRGFDVTLSPIDNENIRALSRVAERAGIESGYMYQFLDYGRCVRAFLKLKAKFTRLPEGEFTFTVDGAPSITASILRGNVEVLKAGKAPDVEFTHLEAENMLLSDMWWTDENKLPMCALQWFPLPVYVASPDSF